MTTQPDLFLSNPPCDFRTEIATWTADEREEFEERAAVIAEGCGVSREESESRAYTQIAERRRVRGRDAR